jgi:hypothetical protein
VRPGIDRPGLRVTAILAAFTTAFLALMASIAFTAFGQVPPPEPQRPPEFQGHGSEAENMRLVGHADLQARSAYQPLTKFNPVNDQWYTYVGHHAGEALNPLTGEVEQNGTSIVRVTNPRRPRQVAHIPATGEGESGAQMVRVCNGEDLPDGDADKVYLLRSNANVSHEIWDVTRPRHAELVTTVVDGLVGTHKSWWDCASGIAYLVSGVPGWRTDRMTQVFDLSDPENPVHIRDFGLVGQEPGSTVEPVPEGIHGGIQLGNRLYNGHGTGANGIFQIVDVEKLLTGPPAPTPENLLFPQIARMDTPRFMGAHTTFPVLGIPVKDDADFQWNTRDIVVLVNEAGGSGGCFEAHQQVFLVDITDEAFPMGISNYKVRESEGNFCERGGRFGSHSSNENMTDDYYRKIVFIAYFNAGVRAVDIRDPFHPREVGKYIPATTENTDERCVDLNDDDVDDVCKIAIQTNNVETDDRNYIYAVDRANTGLHILAVTGEARQIMKSEVEPNPDTGNPLPEGE